MVSSKVVRKSLNEPMDTIGSSRPEAVILKLLALSKLPNILGVNILKIYADLVN